MVDLWLETRSDKPQSRLAHIDFLCRRMFYGNAARSLLTTADSGRKNS